MEEIDEEPDKLVGLVRIRVYNDCFSVEHTNNLSREDIIDLFEASLDTLRGDFEVTEDRVVH
jgi:hypothetical protein